MKFPSEVYDLNNSLEQNVRKTLKNSNPLLVGETIIDQYIFCDTKNPGYKSAKFIKNIIKSNREESKYS